MKRTTNLSSSLEHSLSVYALAASAAGVSLLALAPSAEGRILYTSTNKLIGPHQALPIDLDHDGKSDFKLSNRTTCGTDICFTYLSVKQAAVGNGVVGYGSRDGVQWASALKKGKRIGPGGHFYSKGSLVFMDYGTLNGDNPWAGVANCYLGLKFQIHGKTHYGWARLNVDLNMGGYLSALIAGRLTGYAYETVANKPIITGKTIRRTGCHHRSRRQPRSPRPRSVGDFGVA